MPKIHNTIQEFISILFTRYVNFSSSEKEIEFIEKIYESLGELEEFDSSKLNVIKSSIKQSIDKKTKNSNNIANGRFKKKYLTSILLGLICCPIFYFVDNNQYISKNPHINISVDSSKNNNGPVLSINNIEHFELNYRLPKGSKFETINDEEVLNLIQLSTDKSFQRINISNPTKESISVFLIDSTRVWLSSQSHLEFEYDKGKKIRIARVKGEVLFDVQKLLIQRDTVPFQVLTDLQNIRVLGTKFNVKTLSNKEESVELIEGSIQLSHQLSKTSIFLKSGQNAFLNDSNSNILVIDEDDLVKLKAWKEGLFYFENESILSIALELTNWYGKPIVVSPDLNDLNLTAMIKRFENIDRVLNLLAQTNNFQVIKKEGNIYVNRN